MATSQTDDLGVEVRDGVLAWSPIPKASKYLVIGSDGRQVETSETMVSTADVTDESFVVATVFALSGSEVLAGERIRSQSTQADVEQSLTGDEVSGVLGVQDGMSLLSTMSVSVSNRSVAFEMPATVHRELVSWSLFRNGVLVGQTEGRVIEDRGAKKGVSNAYTVVLDAPEWASVAEEYAWVDAPCTGDCPAGPSDPDEEEGGQQEGLLSGDGLSFTLPVSIPDGGPINRQSLGQPQAPNKVQLVGPPNAESLLSSSEAGAVESGQASEDPIDGTQDSAQKNDLSLLANSYQDDASVWHRTFIMKQYVRGSPPLDTNYFGGDNRGHSTSMAASVRTEVKTITDFETDTVLSYRKTVSPTRRYTRSADGTYRLNETRQGVLNPTVQFFNENGRVRVRVRHSASNPFYFNAYPNIDYEWEYLMVSDGGVTAKGLHDGAPSYETFYEPPFSGTPTRVYAFTEGSFTELSPPMDGGKSWCKPKGAGFNCPGFGTPRWVG